MIHIDIILIIVIQLKNLHLTLNFNLSVSFAIEFQPTIIYKLIKKIKFKKLSLIKFKVTNKKDLRLHGQGQIQYQLQLLKYIN